MARANGKDPLDNDDGHKLKGLVLAGVMGRGSIMSLDYNGNEGMREALLAVLDEMEGPPTTVRRSGRPRKAVDWALGTPPSLCTTTGFKVAVLPSPGGAASLKAQLRILQPPQQLPSGPPPAPGAASPAPPGTPAASEASFSPQSC